MCTNNDQAETYLDSLQPQPDLWMSVLNSPPFGSAETVPFSKIFLLVTSNSSFLKAMITQGSRPMEAHGLPGHQPPEDDSPILSMSADGNTAEHHTPSLDESRPTQTPA